MNTPPRPITDLLARVPLPFVELGALDMLALYPAALDAFLAQAKADFRQVLRQKPSAATFASTARAVMDLSAKSNLLWEVLQSHHTGHASQTTKKLIQKYQPLMTAFSNTVSMSAPLYKLLKAVKEHGGLTLAEKRSLYLLMRGMECAGVHLPPGKQKRLRAINQRMGKRMEKYSDNATDDRKAFFHHFTDDAALADVPPQAMEAAAAEAKNRGLPGWVFTLGYTSYVAVIRYCSDRAVREKFFRANANVATSGKHDNRGIVVEILQLRAEKAKILGYKTFADYIIADRMAGTVTAARKMLTDFSVRCRAHARKELAELKQFSGVKDFQWWDLSYHSARLRKAKYDINETELMQYFPFDRSLAGMFAVAKKLFDVDAVEMPSGSPDIQLYAVSRAGKRIGFLLLDLEDRPEKRAGAWSSLVKEPIVADARREEPVVMNVAGFGKKTGNGPVLLRHGEVVTLFHEFGHALHSLLSEAHERNLNGMHTEWDFVELPSQLLENWCWEAASLNLFARHWKTGQPIPPVLLRRLRESRTFLQGIDMLTQTEYAVMDLLLHTKPPPSTVAQLDRVCQEHSKRHGILPVPVPFRRYASFQHIFAGGYAAGYYSYLWAEVLEADVFSAFAGKNLLSRAMGEKLRTTILSAGSSKPATRLFLDFMGRGPTVSALLKKKGLLSR